MTFDHTVLSLATTGWRKNLAMKLNALGLLRARFVRHLLGIHLNSFTQRIHGYALSRLEPQEQDPFIQTFANLLTYQWHIHPQKAQPYINQLNRLTIRPSPVVLNPRPQVAKPALPEEITEEWLHSLPSNLKDLDLSTCKNVTTLDFSSYLPQLETLKLEWCENLTAEKLTELPSTLKNLNLAGCKKLKDFSLKAICPQLETLNLSNSENLTSKTFNHLPQTLQKLILMNCFQVKDKTLFSLPADLKCLYLNFCIELTDGCLAHLPRSLTELHLNNCSSLEGKTFNKLPPQLEILGLNGCQILPENLPHTLKTLDLTGYIVTNEILSVLPQNLETLNLTSATGIEGGEVLDHLPKRLKNLDLTGCVTLEDDALKHLPKTLKTLDISQCPLITAQGLTYLPKNIQLTADYCQNLSPAVLAAFVEQQNSAL